MESFQDTALQMLREFRKLLSNSPIPIITTRFLQYLALNMFAIEYSRPKGNSISHNMDKQIYFFLIFRKTR